MEHAASISGRLGAPGQDQAHTIRSSECPAFLVYVDRGSVMGSASTSIGLLTFRSATPLVLNEHTRSKRSKG